MLVLLGVHPIETSEPVYLVDVAIAGSFDDVNWGAITQEDPRVAKDNWQVAYDERELQPLADGRNRAAFFFHYLDPARPLLYNRERLPLPPVTPMPPDLRTIEYEEP